MSDLAAVMIVAVLAPAIMHLLTSRARRQDKREDWARQDAVAERLLASNAKVAAVAEEGNAQLHQIHTLVNSNMTAEMEARLVATRGQVVLMHRVITLNRESGQEPTEDEVAAVTAMEVLVKDLAAAIADRLEKTVTAELEAGGLVTNPRS